MNEDQQRKDDYPPKLIPSETARRIANVWLLEYVGNLLGTENPELLTDAPVRWRCDVILGVPDLQKPGTGNRYQVVQIAVNAISGEILNPQLTVQEFQNTAQTKIDQLVIAQADDDNAWEEPE